MRSIRTVLGAILAINISLCSGSSLAQLSPGNASGVSIGHVHYFVPDPAAWLKTLETLGGHLGSSGPLQYVEFPGIYVLVSENGERLPTVQTSANHIGFSVRDYADFKARLQTLGADFFYDDPEAGQIIADLPDGIRIEILTDREQPESIAFHHMHLVGSDLPALQQWYVDVFGADKGERRGLPSALIPGGRVDIMGARGESPKSTQLGRLDHIGFEVDDMDVFAAHLRDLEIDFDIEPRLINTMELTIAFITDPDGTSIEITQGLRELD